MNWSDYEAAWKRQPPPVGFAADLNTLRADFERQRRKLAATLLLRNSIEGFGGIVMAGAFALAAVRIGRDGWPILVGAALILTVAVVFVRDFLRRRRVRVGPEMPLLVRLDAEIAELQHQRWLVANLGWWYFLPYLTAIAVIGAALARTTGRHAPPGLLVALLTTPATLGWIIAIFGVTGFGIAWAWRASRRAVTQRINPRIEELEKLRREILSRDGEAF